MIKVEPIPQMVIQWIGHGSFTFSELKIPDAYATCLVTGHSTAGSRPSILNSNRK